MKFLENHANGFYYLKKLGATLVKSAAGDYHANDCRR